MRRRICLNCHNKGTCKVRPQDHWKGLSEGRCSVCKVVKESFLCGRVVLSDEEIVTKPTEKENE